MSRQKRTFYGVAFDAKYPNLTSLKAIGKYGNPQRAAAKEAGHLGEGEVRNVIVAEKILTDAGFTLRTYKYGVSMEPTTNEYALAKGIRNRKTMKRASLTPSEEETVKKMRLTEITEDMLPFRDFN